MLTFSNAPLQFDPSNSGPLWLTLTDSGSLWLGLALSGNHRLTRSLLGSPRCGAWPQFEFISGAHTVHTVVTVYTIQTALHWTIRYAKGPHVHGQNLIETAMGYFWQKITGSATWAWHVPASFNFNPMWGGGAKTAPLAVFNFLKTNGREILDSNGIWWSLNPFLRFYIAFAG